MTPDARSGETVITLGAMKFDALIGILPHEAETAQPVEVDLTLTVSRAEGETDPRSIVDYRHAYQLVEDVMTAGHLDFLEEACDRIAVRALSLPLVQRVSVAVRKMKVALPGPLAFAEVKIERSRG